jgi:hypothetical protein
MGYGFNFAIGVALVLYAVAFGVFQRLHRAEFAHASQCIPAVTAVPTMN